MAALALKECETFEGIYAEHIEKLFSNSRKRYGLTRRDGGLSTAHFRRVHKDQLSLF